jgi:glucuronate isomerase
MSLISEHFLLQSKTARTLYRTYAEKEPVLDYHNHLSAREIAGNRRFHDLYEIWLESDHYKWRAMRTNGVPERYCSGDAAPYEKFQAWARTVPYTLRNPLYHWTHLELNRYFGIEDLLDENSAPEIWKRANAMLASDELSVHGILKRFDVRALCTSDDPADSLDHHQAIAASALETRVYPTFRPDRAIQTADQDEFNRWTDRLGASANIDILCFTHFLDALTKRHNDFHAVGCRLSDHGLSHCYSSSCTDAEAGALFSKLRARKPLTGDESEHFAGYMMLFFGRLDAAKGWTKQLHLGALRDVNSPVAGAKVRDTGYDTIGDWPQAQRLAAYLGKLEEEDSLPRIVIYNNNPSDNYVFATMVGNFHDRGFPAKVQFGSAWWFLDQKEGIEWQLNALSNTGLLSRFVGMVTDSRSFMSFPRHEYFRRVLCNLIGNEVETGLLPDNEELIGPMIRNVCYGNAAAHFGLEVGPGSAASKAGSAPAKTRT